MICTLIALEEDITLVVDSCELAEFVPQGNVALSINIDSAPNVHLIPHYELLDENGESIDCGAHTLTIQDAVVDITLDIT